MKYGAKNALCLLYRRSGAMHVQERLAHWSGRRFSSILLFHRVTDDIPADGLTVTTQYFRELCQVLQARFRVISLSDMCRRLREGQALEPRTLAITFDDCYYDNLPAARVLAEHGLPACFFVPSGYVGTDHVFPWDQQLKRMPNLGWHDVAEMVRLGHEIGSHTVHHVDLGAVERDEARRELAESKQQIEDRLGRPVRWLAYPFGGRGHFKPEYQPLATELGYEACFSAYGGVLRPGMWGQVLPREAVPSFRSVNNLELHLTGCLDWFYRLKRRAGLIA
jgi:peptidoglycan/xylan/chitin deacetylase (PgdA/CDA1 family)